MNLIEKLGGYEKSKRELELKEEDSVFQCCNAITSDMIRNALLEHRRQHNIYEIGDKIVSTLDGSEDWKNAICEILAFHKKMAITTGFSCAIHHYDYRHATPEEIKAGRRL